MGSHWIQNVLYTGYVILFLCSMTIGIVVQQLIRQKLWRFAYISFVPLIWLLFVTVFKLL